MKNREGELEKREQHLQKQLTSIESLLKGNKVEIERLQTNEK